MRTINKIAAVTIVVLSAVFCLAQFSSKKPASMYNQCQQEATAAAISKAEDVSLINLLTFKFM